MARTKSFDEHIGEYEQWFIDHRFVFLSELAALRAVIPGHGTGVEIGVGSGIFASSLGIRYGIDPSRVMLEKARERGIDALYGIAEQLPYPDNSFDYALMVTTICFVDDVKRSFHEVYRILKRNGIFIIGFVDKDSPVGKVYLGHKDENVFYKDAVFYSTGEVYGYLEETGFRPETTLQTVFGMLGEADTVQTPEEGYGKGSFVVIRVVKVQ